MGDGASNRDVLQRPNVGSGNEQQLNTTPNEQGWFAYSTT